MIGVTNAERGEMIREIGLNLAPNEKHDGE